MDEKILKIYIHGFDPFILLELYSNKLKNKCPDKNFNVDT